MCRPMATANARGLWPQMPEVQNELGKITTKPIVFTMYTKGSVCMYVLYCSYCIVCMHVCMYACMHVCIALHVCIAM